MTTSRVSKRAYHHGDLEAALLRTAGKILEKEGLEALGLRELARRAGVSHSAPYRHFPDLESLREALACEGFVSLARTLQEAGSAGGLRARGAAYVRFALQNPQRFRLMLGGHLGTARHAALREAATPLFDSLSGTFAALIAGQAGRDASLAAWSLVHGLSLLLLNEEIAGSARAGRATEEFVGSILNSVRFTGRTANPVAAAAAQPPA